MNTRLKYKRNLKEDLFTNEEMSDFLDKVVDNIEDFDANTNVIITTAFGNKIDEDFYDLTDMELENLFNIIDQKLKTQNELRPYMY